MGGYRPHPIGAYGELLILNHPLFTQRRLSTIRKISFQPSLLCNRTTALGHLKKLVSFDWDIQDRQMICKIQHVDLQLAIQLKKCFPQRSFHMNTRYIPTAFLKI